jgi:PAS domain S-box-containing protein
MAEESGQFDPNLRFGVFELDVRTGELRKQGLKIKLQNQPLQILTTLLENPGELVTREELQKKIWPPCTFVDVDHSLSTSINKLRDALGDSANSPRFIETTGRRGYRFLAPIGTSSQRSESPVEEVRRDENDMFRLLVESVRDYAIFMLDIEGNIRTWNSGAQRIQGYRTDEIVGRRFSCLYTPEDLKLGKSEEGLKIAAEQGRSYAEGWRVRKDGARFWASDLISAVRDEAGQLVGFSKITRDVTDRRQPTEPARPVQVRRQLLSLGLVAAIAIAVAVAIWPPSRTSRAPTPLMHFQVDLQPPLDLRIWPQADLAISPDGAQLVYRGSFDGADQLYLRAVHRLESTPLAGAEGGYCPFFSPDGEWIGFFAAGKLKKL